jgi:hypothetical protein
MKNIVRKILFDKLQFVQLNSEKTDLIMLTGKISRILMYSIADGEEVCFYYGNN